jgi:hypothetical protein
VDIDTSEELASEWLVARWNGSPNYQPVVANTLFRIYEGMNNTERHWVETFKAQTLANEEKERTVKCGAEGSRSSIK